MSRKTKRFLVIVLPWLLIPFLLEGFMRISIAYDLFELRRAGHYFHPFCEGDYYRLMRTWTRKDPGQLSAHYARDSFLGWVKTDPVLLPRKSREYRFGSLGTGNLLNLIGWHPPEEGFMHMASTASSISLNCVDGQVACEVDVVTPFILKKEKDERTLTVKVNGRVIKIIPVSELPDNWQAKTISLQIGSAKLEASGRSVLTFELPFLLSPKEMGLRDDARMLGLTVSSLKIRQPEEKLGKDRRRLAIFGDSYMAGVEQLLIAERIPSLVSQELPEFEVYDYAVNAYGTGQIYLRFLEAIRDPKRKPDIAIIGVTLTDIDRVLMRFFATSKPYFSFEDNSLILRGVPIKEEAKDVASIAPTVFSYLARYLMRTFEDWRERPWNSQCNRKEKEDINRAIISNIARLGRENNVKVYFVIFYEAFQLPADHWKERMLKGLLKDYEMEYIDVREIYFSNTAFRENVPNYFYPPPNNHPKLNQNVLIAEKIVARIRGYPDLSYRASVRWPEDPGLLRLMGWRREKDYLLMADSRAELGIICRSGMTSCKVSVEIAGFVVSPYDPRSLNIKADGRVVRSVPLTKLSEGKVISFSIDDSPLNHAYIKLSFELPYLIASAQGKMKARIAVKAITVE